MKRNQIKRISEAQITDAAFANGRSIIKALSKVNLVSPGKRDSIGKRYHIRLELLKEGAKLADAERQITEAYAAAGATLSDNVQKTTGDSLLYTQPISKELPDGSKQFNYAVGIKISKRQLVLSIK